ncbi:MAG TPA: IclR family transcriptional regulator [Clostridium sp.]|nr:IclR family transcriptional regulator [Clostridium sp.]
MEIIRSVERSFYVLETLSNYPKGLGITELCNLTDLSKATIFRILNTLIQLGYVNQNLQNSKYLSTFKLLEVGTRKIDGLDIRKLVHPYLKEICEITNETVHLVVKDGIYGVYIDKIKPNKSITMNTNIGMRKPLYCTAYGKILISDLSTDEIKDLWSKSNIEKYTDNTITDLSVFLEEQEAIKNNQYALDDEEVEDNICCISSPIRDYSNKIVAAISLSYIKSNTTNENILNYISIIKKYSKLISNALGAK